MTTRAASLFAGEVTPARLVVLALLGAYAALLVALGGHGHWATLGVTQDRVPFADLLSVTSAWQCAREHVAVMVMNPCDPLHASANFPNVWTRLGFLGLGPGDDVALGFLIVSIFVLAALVVLPRRASVWSGLVYGLALCSPAVMLGVERGNVDILLFAFVVLAALLLRRGRVGAVAAHALILLAAALKLFPIFAAGVLVRQRRSAAIVGLAAVLGAFAVYAVVIRSELHTLAKVTPQVDDFSYGMRLFSEWLAAVATKVTGSPLTWMRLRDWNVVLALPILAAALFARHRGGRWQPKTDPDDARALDLFLVGAGVYVCTYVAFNSFDYRLAFLLAAFPQLQRWARERRPFALVALIAIFGAIWFDPSLTAHVPLLGRFTREASGLLTFGAYEGIRRPLTIAVLMQFVLFASLVGCIVAAAPEVRLPFGRRSAAVSREQTLRARSPATSR